MAAACNNCGRVLECGCSRRLASDNTSVCAACVEAYEKSIQSTNSSPNNGNQ